jgi:hypothetical protein
MITTSCTETSSTIMIVAHSSLMIFLFRPENILYRTKDPGSDIVIADFGMYVENFSLMLAMPKSRYFLVPNTSIRLKNNCTRSQAV